MSQSSASNIEESHNSYESVGRNNVDGNARALFFSTHVTVPPWATVIYCAAFRLHLMLKEVELPNELDVIKDYAFEG